MQTRVTQLLGIEHPIFQGGMAWISDYHLAAAVSNAGAAGIIATGGRDAAWTRDQILKTKALTDKPFGVNLSLAQDNPNLDEIIRILCEEEISFVTVGAGNPIPFIETFHAAGVKVVGIIPNLRLAKRVEAAGIDMIVVEGTEAGGTIGRLSTMALMTNVIPEVSIPVLAAGAIVDGRGLAAALMMGAAGIQMGTRFLASAECVVHPQYKEKILRATDDQSVSTGLSRNMGMRGLRSPFSEKFTQMEISGVSDAELSAFATGASRAVAENGLGPDGMNGMVQCGQGLVPIKEIKTARQIVEDTVREAEELLLKAPGLVQ
jgi:enoyl-[acyl-carrier protein] reductase II